MTFTACKELLGRFLRMRMQVARTCFTAQHMHGP